MLNFPGHAEEIVKIWKDYIWTCTQRRAQTALNLPSCHRYSPYLPFLRLVEVPLGVIEAREMQFFVFCF